MTSYVTAVCVYEKRKRLLLSVGNQFFDDERITMIGIFHWWIRLTQGKANKEIRWTREECHQSDRFHVRKDDKNFNGKLRSNSSGKKNIYIYQSLTCLTWLDRICCIAVDEKFVSVMSNVGGIVARSNELIVLVLLSSLTILSDVRNNVRRVGGSIVWNSWWVRECFRIISEWSSGIDGDL